MLDPYVARMRQTSLPIFGIVLTLGFAAVTLLVIAGHEATGRGYTHPLSVRDFPELISSATWEEVEANFTWSAAHWLLFGVTIALATTAATHRKVSSSARAAAFGAQVLLVWPGWLGLLALPSDLAAFAANRQDGEYMGEAWMMLELEGVWLLFALSIFAVEVRQIVKSSGRAVQVSPPP